MLSFFLKISCRGQKNTNTTCQLHARRRRWQFLTQQKWFDCLDWRIFEHEIQTTNILHAATFILQGAMATIFVRPLDRDTVKTFFRLKNFFFLILSHDGNVLNGWCSFRTNISPYIKTLDQKRTPFSSGHAVETIFVQIPAENAPHVARALSSRIQERQNAFQIIWTWLLFRDAFRGQKNANFIRTGTILYIELSSSKINKKKILGDTTGNRNTF